MKNEVTEKFIRARQKHCKSPLVVKSVQAVGGGIPNDCYGNAYDNVDHKKGIRVISGWLVGPYDAVSKTAEIIQHFWNADNDNNHFDTTFATDLAGHEYVADINLMAYYFRNDAKLNSHVASSLLYVDGKYNMLIVSNDNHYLFKQIDELSTETLYRDSMN